MYLKDCDASQYTPHPTMSCCEAICKSGDLCTKLGKHEVAGKHYCGIHIKSAQTPHLECSICLGDISNKNRIKLGCGHIFHTSCMTNWAQQDKDTCPLCRTAIDVDSLITLNQGILEYIGRIVFSLPLAHRHYMFNNIMQTLDSTYRAFTQQTGTLLYTQDTPVGPLSVYDDRERNLAPRDPRLSVDSRRIV